MVEFEWIVPESQRDAQVTAIEVAGGTVEASRAVYRPAAEEVGDYGAAGFEPLTMIVAVGSIAFVVEALAKAWRDRRAQGGVIVDARGGKLRIRPVANLPSGRLVVMDESGTRVFDRKDENASRALLTDVLARLGRSP